MRLQYDVFEYETKGLCALQYSQIYNAHTQPYTDTSRHTSQSVYIILFEMFMNQKNGMKSQQRENFLCLVCSMSFSSDSIENHQQ